jgi:ubiquinone/menaquinone biosynthesis C-methylase UbiE
VTDTGMHGHERRYGSAAERLRAPARLALLEIPRVISLSKEGITVARMLDVGTGTGIFAESFAHSGCEVTGIDPNTDLLAVARRHSAGVFLVGAAEKLPFEDGSFDLVMMGHVLHETDDRAAAIREACRVARHRVAILEWPYIEEEQGPPLAHRLQESEIRSLAHEAGFAVIDMTILSHMHLYRLTP